MARAVLLPSLCSCMGGLQKMLGERWLWCTRKLKSSVGWKEMRQTVFSTFSFASRAETLVFPTPIVLVAERFGARAWMGIWLSDGHTFLPSLQRQLDRWGPVQDRPPLLRVPPQLRRRLPEQPLLQRCVGFGDGMLCSQHPPAWGRSWSQLSPGNF